MKMNMLQTSDPIPGRYRSFRPARRLAVWVLWLLPMFILRAQLTYSTNDNAITITGYTGTASSLTIPETMDGFPVKEIGSAAFRNQRGLIHVTIPDSVTTIGFMAFGNCSGLTNLTIPKGVDSIEIDAFAGCKALVTISVDAANPAYSSVDGVLFSKDQTELILYPEARGVSSYVIPDGVISIRQMAFDSCAGLAEVTFPKSVTSMEAPAFYACPDLQGFAIDEANPSFSDLDGVLFNKDQTELIVYPPARGGTSYAIPDGVTGIGMDAFLRSRLSRVTIPESVTNIEFEAFRFCSGLAEITIPNSVINIGDWAFASCAGLTNATVGSGVTNIGFYAFVSCTALKSISIEESNRVYTSAGGVLLSKDQSELILYPTARTGDPYTIPSSVTTIRSRAFEGCSNLRSLTIPKTVIRMDNPSLYSCPVLTAVSVDEANPTFSSDSGVLFNKDRTTLILYPRLKSGGSYTIPDGVTNVGAAAFVLCAGLTNVTIPDRVISIGNNAFFRCSGLRRVAIPDSVTSIGYYAYGQISGLTSVSIGRGVTHIGNFAFYANSNLTSVTFEGDQPSGATNLFVGAFPTLYHLTGTTGWLETFAGRPTLLWNPSALPSDAGFAVNGGTFGFNITGTPGITVIVEASPNPATGPWIPVGTNTLADGSSLFTDPTGLRRTGTFYRFRTP